MISLREAIKICKIEDDECVMVLINGADPRNLDKHRIMTGEEIKKRFDIRRLMVHRIEPWFVCNDYEGFKFVIGRAAKRNVNDRGGSTTLRDIELW